jgi:hypothetical protein
MELWYTNVSAIPKIIIRVMKNRMSLVKIVEPGPDSFCGLGWVVFCVFMGEDQDSQCKLPDPPLLSVCTWHLLREEGRSGALSLD